MIEIDLDGKKVSVPEGSMVMHAADAAGTYIPHFCYHKKLSIAANCRMCLVDIEKAPKPMPACATPVTQGMIVRTRSDKAINAQQGVMEFLLINHPLDCPICDQGGECQLQDLAVGYGASTSRYDEDKRVVYPKDVGPLISMQEMNRCIHCTRCVRFGIEVAGVMELGMINRGEHSEITTVAGDTVDSELSGNMIDLCPVGALLSKPFRFRARNWELSRRKSVSPHDSVGTNLLVQVKGARVMRVLPLENESVNECWISDRDRFSYEALGTEERLTQPMIRQGGEWKTVDWTAALDYVARGLTQIAVEHGPQSVGALAHPMSTAEELHLLAKLVRGLGSDNVDTRLREAAPQPPGGPIRWLGRPIASLSELQRVLVVGSFLRKDLPLLAVRLRAAAKRGAKVMSVHALRDDWLMAMGPSLAVAPSAWPQALADIAGAVAAARGVPAPAEGRESDEARAIAAALLSGERKAVLLGSSAAQHPEVAVLERLGRWIAEQTGASFGWLVDGANSVGAELVNARPAAGGLDASRMLAADAPLKACVLLNVDPSLDCADPVTATAALAKAEMVVSLSAFKPAPGDDRPDVLLPVSPFTETAGTFVSAEGRVQSFRGVVKPLGEARPAWKVLRVLGNLLGLAGFAFETADEVRAEALGDVAAVPGRLAAGGTSAAKAATSSAPAGTSSALERIADVPIHAADPLVRRSKPLQLTADARPPRAGIPSELAAERGIGEGSLVRVTQGSSSVVLAAHVDPSLASNVIRVAAAHPLTAALGPMFGPVEIAAEPAGAAAAPDTRHAVRQAPAH
ncbi:MAG TPA: NADH-quinone oxidoreductase subunit NuoG [Caldimonas sp.]|jgi:NADH-quinone oxidoreductase subunit G|nr:NADH-quinone oxidoreductase subunit NuoG [Caldimonas sp.]HEX2540087.1 NADH-quinone oxidoreductase subunit NuoG [Caldimonas sp.]